MTSHDHTYCLQQEKAKRNRRRVKLAISQRKYLKQFTHKCEENLKAKRYWEQEDDESDEMHHKKKVILDINELSSTEVNTMYQEDITYDGIVQDSSYGSNEFNCNVDGVNKNLEEGNSSSSTGDEDSHTKQYRHGKKLCRQDLNEKQCVLLDKFQDENMLCNLIKNLDEVNLTEDFLCLLDVLSTGEMENENLPLILVMEVARYLRCTTTTLMRFHEKSKAFWRVGYRTWHGKGLLLMSGSKNRGELKNNETQRGYYKPSSSSFNFVVPDVKTLFRGDDMIPKEIKPTACIKESYDLVDKEKEHVLMYDCKKVVRGFKGKSLGDEDLWDFEGQPTVKESMKRIEDELKIVTNLKQLCDDENMEEISFQCMRLMNCISVRLKEIRKVESDHRRVYGNLVKNPASSELVKSFFRSQIYSCKMWAKGAINANRDLCTYVCSLNDTLDCHKEVGTVDLLQQPNYDILLPTDVLGKYLDLDTNPEIVKQRSDKWLELRMNARVTGSTCFKGIGLGLLREQQEHYDEYILGKRCKEKSSNLRQKLLFGSENEIHGTATVACILMPTFLPPCMQLVEDGCNFLHGKLINRMVEVSSDGVIECQKGFHQRPCVSSCVMGHYKRIVEIKCITDESLIAHRYHIPIYHATQMLLEMHAKLANEGWYVVVTEQTVILITLQFDKKIYDNLWSIISEEFDVEIPNRPKRINKERQKFKEVLKKYVKEKSIFMCEVPKIKSTEIGTLNECTILGPYRSVYTCKRPKRQFSSYVEDLHCTLNECTKYLDDAYDLQRRRACEILAFILSDTDRHYKMNTPANNPIAYALKGPSIKMDTMRLMIEEVRDKCKEQNVKILTEVADGQFRKIVCRTIDDKPLTWLGWQKDLWNESMQRNKEDLMHILEAVAYVSDETLCKLHESKCPKGDFSFNHENLQVDGMRINGEHKMFLSSNGGPVDDYETLLMGEIYTTQRWKHTTYDPIWDYKQAGTERKSSGDVITEQQILEMIACENFPDPYDISRVENQNECDEYDDNRVKETHPKTLLSEILRALLKTKNGAQWINVTTTQLYVDKLCSAKSIAENFYAYELDEIAKVVSQIFGCKMLFAKSSKKHFKVNVISKYFGDKSVWYPKKKKLKHKDPLTLRNISAHVIVQSYYPKTILAASVCRITHELEFHKWKKSQSIPIATYLSPLQTSFQFFAYPEKSEKRQQIEARTFDPTHIVTNLRVHLCKKGFQKVRSNAFREVCDRNNALLSRAIVYEEADKQNIEIAMQVFSEEVECDIRKHGDGVTADFVGLIRRWFNACDERGISVHNRLQWLMDMHDYLISFYDERNYPPPSTHIYGLPLQTFEMILQSTSLRIALYHLSSKHTFNHRAISTGGIESFFSDLSIIEITGTGCPKAYQIPKLISIIVEYNTAKHDPTKLFKMDRRRGVPYRSSVHDIVNDSCDDENVDCDGNVLPNYYRSHTFDKTVRTGKKRKKFLPHISGPLQTARGEVNIRTVGKFKVNESRIKACTRLGVANDVPI